MRVASSHTRNFVAKRMQRRRRKRSERFRRTFRRSAALFASFRASALRFILVAILGLLALVFGLLLFSPIMEVREVQVERLTPRLDIEEVQEALAPIFGRHTLFLSSFEISMLLRDRIPDIDEITVGKAYPATVFVRISLHPLVARLDIADPETGDVPTATGTGVGLDFLTSEGIYVRTLAADNDADVLPLLTIVDWGVRPEPGVLLLTPVLFERMKSAELALLRQFGKEVSRRIVYVRSQEFHLQIENIRLWFDLTSALEDQIQRYRIFLASGQIGEVKEYIDLRLSDRVVYK